MLQDATYKLLRWNLSFTQLTTSVQLSYYAGYVRSGVRENVCNDSKK